MRVKWFESVGGNDRRERVGRVIGTSKTLFFGKRKFVVVDGEGVVREIPMDECEVVKDFGTSVRVLLKRLSPDAVVPSYAHDSDAGLDMVATTKRYDSEGNVVFGTGIAVEIPGGFVGLIFPRSSISRKSLSLSNCVGVIDSGYRGEITFKFKKLYDYSYGSGLVHNVSSEYNVGERIGQMIIIPYPKVVIEESDSLSESERGEGGYGSTGK